MEIRVEDLEYTYNPGTPLERTALTNISFTASPGTVTGILGANGSGKTTLARIINGLLEPTKGRVLVDGKDTRSYGPELRRKVGLVFQRPERQLFEETVFRDISFVLRRFSKLPQREVVHRVEQATDLVGLDIKEIASRSPMALSEGERRKVAIAGILTNHPEALVLDEPTVGLDLPSALGLVDLIRNIKRSESRIVVIVSHDLDPFLNVLDNIIVLDKGSIAAMGSAAEVCSALGDNHTMRPFLPEPALLLYDLHKKGVPVTTDEFRLPILAQQLAEWLGKSPGDPSTS